jgi:dipeptidyl-peptidase-4
MDTDEFPRQFARTGRFSFGVPRDFTVTPRGVLFLRSASGSSPRPLLWRYRDGGEQVLADLAGLSAYAADREGGLVACAADGGLWVACVAGAGPRRLPVAGPVRDPRPSPDGSLIAYVAGGALRVVRADGTRDRALAEPEAADVTYGLPDYAATASIGRRRGYWWSPGGEALLVARVDAAMVHRRYLSDPADPAAPPRSQRYPAAGTPNARTTVRVVTVDGRHTEVRLPREVPVGEVPPGGWGPAFEYLITADWPDWPDAGPVLTLQSRDQRTAWILRADPASGAVEPLARYTSRSWVEFPPGAPLFTASGVAVLPRRRGDARSIQVGPDLAPAGLHVRAVLGAAGERVLFTASREPAEVHVWSHEPGRGFERLTSQPGVHTAAAGGDTVVLDSRTPDGQTVTVLRAGQPAGQIAVLAEPPLVRPRPRHVVLGRRRLRARLHLPSWHQPGTGRLPVLLSPYAGPGMQVVTRAQTWHGAVCQWFAEQGFAVLVADGRGTPGRGIRWQEAILGDRLTPVLADQVGALHAAARLAGDLDLGRVAIRGWSFSGYLAAGAVLRRPDVFHAAVAGAPVVDRRLYDTYWEERYLGHPGLDPGGYDRSSLGSLAAGLTRPLLLVHGLADDNVAPAHTLRLSAALLAAGRPHRVLLLPGTGHAVSRPGVADALLRAELDFLREALPGPSPHGLPGPAARAGRRS